MNLPADFRTASARIEVPGLSPEARERVVRSIQSQASEHARCEEGARIIRRGGPEAELIRKVASESIPQTGHFHSASHKKAAFSGTK